MEQTIKAIPEEQLGNQIAVIVGTRPGIVMFSPIIHELQKRKSDFILIHTGQHYSPNMDNLFFSDLDLPAPDFRLDNVCQYKTHAGQTAQMLMGLEQIFLKTKPRIVLVGGDANSHLSAALAARKLGIKVGHVEAGERSFDWRMPEEHNRRIIDHISDYLFATGEKAKMCLQKESVEGEIVVTGNTIVDASLQHAKIALKTSTALTKLKLIPKQYCLLTTHREENVDLQKKLCGILTGAQKFAAKFGMNVIFPVHPRTQKRLDEFGLTEWTENLSYVRMIKPVGYLDFLSLLINSRLVFTDAGGVQQEACIHKIPTVTIRENTEWTETISAGANCLAGTAPEKICAAAETMLEKKTNWDIQFGDGSAAKYIVDAIQ